MRIKKAIATQLVSTVHTVHRISLGLGRRGESICMIPYKRDCIVTMCTYSQIKIVGAAFILVLPNC